MFYTTPCGCIYLDLATDNTQVLVMACDGSDYGLRTHRRDDGPHTPLHPEAASSLLEDLNRLIADGYRLREIKVLLSP